VEISNISGTGFGGLPTFGNRAISTTIRLRDGETNMLAGLIRDDERRSLQGVPGLSDLPLIGRLFAYNKTETQQTDIILVITPHIVRVLELSEQDLRPFRVGGDAASGGMLPDLPMSPTQDPVRQDPEEPGVVPATPAGQPSVIRPPSPSLPTTIPPPPPPRPIGDAPGGFAG
jgi:general secretion pathway protein D